MVFAFILSEAAKIKIRLNCGLFYTPLILSNAMQSLVINTRTGPITVKLCATLRHLTQVRGKNCTGRVTSHRTKLSLGFLHLPVIAFTTPSPTNTSWFSPVDCCSSQHRVPKQIPVFPCGGALCTMRWGWMILGVQMPECWTPGIFCSGEITPAVLNPPLESSLQ